MNELAKGKQAVDHLGLALDEGTLEFDDILEALADSVGDDPYVHDLLNQLAEQHGEVAQTANKFLGVAQQLIEQVKVVLQAALEERDKAIREHQELARAVEHVDINNPSISELYETVEEWLIEAMGESEYYERLEWLKEEGFSHDDAHMIADAMSSISAMMDEPEVFVPALKNLVAHLEKKQSEANEG